MATIRQKRLAEAIVENVSKDEPETVKELMVRSGYSLSSAEASPHVIVATQGVQEELEALGFNESTAKKVVAEILVNGEEESSRLKAADMVFKVHGSYAPTESKNLNVDVKVDSKDLSKHDSLREEYEAKLRQSYLED